MSRHGRKLLCCLVALLALAVTAPGGGSAAPRPSRLDPALRGALVAAPGAELPVIVSFGGRIDPVAAVQSVHGRKRARAELVRRLRQQAEASQSSLWAFLDSRGKSGVKELWIINGLALRADKGLIEEISLRPEVESIRLDGTVPAPAVTRAAGAADLEWNVAAVRAPALWEMGFAGQEVVVATLDTGVDPLHADLAGRWRGGSNSWFDPYLGTGTPYDKDGHGTAVMGLLVGGDAGGTAIGVAPAARWIAAKIFNDATPSTATFSAIHQAYQWILDPDGDPATDDAPAVVNNSWGLTGIDACSAEFAADVAALRAAGILAIFSAGNAGPGPASSVSPANNPGSLAVGMVAQSLVVDPASSRGPSACDGSIYPELTAPGVAVRTADLTAGAFPLSYTTVTGTSFAAPQAAGVLALLLGAFPGKTPAAVEAAVFSSAADLGPPGPDNAYGHGLVDALAAFELLAADPDLTVVDSIPPADDRRLDFGSVPPSFGAEGDVTLHNAGSADLLLGGIDAGPAPFAIVADSCPAVLAPGGSCVVTVRFVPQSQGEFSGELVIASNDPDEPSLMVALHGLGNTLPPPPRLVSPADGASGLATSLTFIWQQGADPDGDAVQNSLVISKFADFRQSAVFPASGATAGRGVAVWGCGALLAGGAICRRRGRGALWGLLLAGALLLGSCGGEGGSSGAGGLESQAVSGLENGTTYYWKVSAEDDVGGVVESVVRRFSTRP